MFFKGFINLFCFNCLKKRFLCVLYRLYYNPQGQDLYSSLTGKADFNITLPMILSEWQELNEESFEFTELLTKMTEKLDEEYWMNWTPDNNTQFASGALQKRS